MSELKVAASADVQEGSVHVAKVEGHTVALSRIGGKVCAFSPKCPHLGLSLARGKIVDGAITCPFHGSRFDMCSGKNLDWANALVGIPMPQWSHSLLSFGKKPAPLTVYEASERDGAVHVKL
jgi:nitrite reductase/ring-hydroxylating ferredoxin subunit